MNNYSRWPDVYKGCGTSLCFLLFLIILLSVGGCAVLGPDYQSPEVKIASIWSEQGMGQFTPSGVDDSVEWWQKFNDPVLTNLIQIAYKENLTLQTAALRIVEARAQLARVRGNWYPQAQEVNGDLTSIGTTAPARDRYYNAASIGFDVGWEMDFWGKFQRSIQSADANVLATVADYGDILVSLTAEVARIYIDIRTFQERISLAGQNVELQQKSLNLVNLQLEAGVVTELDLLQAKTLLSSTKATIPNLQAALSTYKNSLAVLLGMLPENIDIYLKQAAGIPELQGAIALVIPAELLRRRPDIRRSEMQAAAQSAQIGVSLAELYPSFTLFGSVGWSATDTGSNSLGDIFESNNFSYSFGPSFKWNIFNYGRLKNQVRVQDARYQQALLQYQNSVLNAAKEVENALQSLSYTVKEAGFLKEGVATSGKSTELSMLQYQEGLADYQRVLDSTRALTQKQDQYAQTKGKIATTAVSLYKALGGGWGGGDKRPFLPDSTVEQMELRTDWGNMLQSETKTRVH